MIARHRKSKRRSLVKSLSSEKGASWRSARQKSHARAAGTGRMVGKDPREQRQIACHVAHGTPMVGGDFQDLLSRSYWPADRRARLDMCSRGTLKYIK
jgi:hypothetical protein